MRWALRVREDGMLSAIAGLNEKSEMPAPGLTVGAE